MRVGVETVAPNTLNVCAGYASAMRGLCAKHDIMMAGRGASQEAQLCCRHPCVRAGACDCVRAHLHVRALMRLRVYPCA